MQRQSNVKYFLKWLWNSKESNNQVIKLNLCQNQYAKLCKKCFILKSKFNANLLFFANALTSDWVLTPHTVESHAHSLSYQIHWCSREISSHAILHLHANIPHHSLENQSAVQTTLTYRGNKYNFIWATS